MELEVFVPVPAERLRAALADPARVARAVPGLQQDAGGEPGAGRLKVRVGSHSITYRGFVRVSAQDDGSYAVEADATEARGTGAVKAALTLHIHDTDDGATLTFSGTASADGRVTELPGDAVEAAVTRLLNRFAENLGAEDPETGEPGRGTAEAGTQTEPEAEPEAEPEHGPEEPEAEPEHGPGEPASGHDTEAPPPSPDQLAQKDAGTPEPPAVEDPVAEAAHARRTMIGRSAEEVDHAPPRGRYAPVPAPQTVAPNPALRWAVPAAALGLASAIVVVRALRRRR